MKQIVQSVGSGKLRVVDVPTPVIGPTEVLVATTHSVISAGTERSGRQLAGASMLAKARARPDLVRQVVRRARTAGVRSTVQAVRQRLDDDMPLGYSGAGTVVEVGEAVSGLVPGQAVATGSAGHAEMQVVPAPLAVPIPSGVSNEDAAFATLGAIALHGLRLADVGAGSKVCVIGLGLLGQLALRLCRAAGYDATGLDVREWPVARAQEAGLAAHVDSGEDTTGAVLEWSRGRGADAVLVAAATPSSDPVLRAPALARDRASVVVLGDVGLQLERRPFYEKELSLKFARSYGPGRYERSYEEWAVDYPPGYVRWTEGRNLEAVLDLRSTGQLTVADLVTHRFPITEAERAYSVLEGDEEPSLGVQFVYGHATPESRAVAVAPRRSGDGAVGLIGAGNFARATLVPAMREAGFDRLAYVASASGRSARVVAERFGFERAAASADVVIDDPDVSTVFIATPHDTHAELAVQALRAGKHVFCEKPLALSDEELAEVAASWRSCAGQLLVGFNRRWSPAVRAVQRHFGPGSGPLVLTYRVSAGRLPEDHWYRDRRQGGRLLGEVCHFVDTCNSVVGAAVESVAALGSARSELLLDEDVAVLLRYTDGSVASISYASGGCPATPKERVEVLGRGRSALVDDFCSVRLDEKETWRGPADKGHRAQLEAFRRAVATGIGLAEHTEAAFATTAATLAAVESLRTGCKVKPAAA